MLNLSFVRLNVLLPPPRGVSATPRIFEENVRVGIAPGHRAPLDFPEVTLRIAVPVVKGGTSDENTSEAPVDVVMAKLGSCDGMTFMSIMSAYFAVS
jgi:hypothetical protein